ncbi:unnamed protein product [Pylaiella littoralis]
MALRVPSAAIKNTPALDKKRILKNMSAVSGAMVLGDAVCQGMETFGTDKKFTWDHARTMRMGITGAFLVTPASFSWNLYAERIAPGTSWRAIVTKLGVSIAVLPPMLAAQFTSLTLLEKGKNGDDVYRKLSRDFVPTLKNALLFWPLISVVNSALIPVLSRPIFSSFAGVFWNVYISYQANHNGMDVGELSVVYSQTEEREGVLTKVVVEKAVEETAVATTAAAAAAATAATAATAAPAAAAAAVAAPSTAVVSDAQRERVTVSPTDDATVVIVRDGRPEVPGTAAPDAPPTRKRRGKLVRRTSFVSM